jgi:hypothetical protein
VEPQFATAFVTTFGIVTSTKRAIDGWLVFNHMVIERANGHKTHGNFPFVQKGYIIIIVIKYYNYNN